MMPQILAQVDNPVMKSDPSQMTALWAVITIAVAFVYSAIKGLADSKTERREIVEAFSKMLSQLQQEAHAERTANTMNVERVCKSFDNAVDEMRKHQEESRKACLAYRGPTA